LLILITRVLLAGGSSTLTSISGVTLKLVQQRFYIIVRHMYQEDINWTITTSRLDDARLAPDTA
jgi:hypothetical protein